MKTGVARFSRIFGTMLMNSSSLSHPYKPSPPLPSLEVVLIYIQNTFWVYFFLSILRPLLWTRACILDYMAASIYLHGTNLFLELLPFLGSLVSFTKPSSGPAWSVLLTRMSLLTRRRMNIYLLNEVNTYLNHCNYLLYAPSDFIFSPFLPLTILQHQCLEERFHALGIDILFSYKI